MKDGEETYAVARLPDAGPEGKGPPGKVAVLACCAEQLPCLAGTARRQQSAMEVDAPGMGDWVTGTSAAGL